MTDAERLSKLRHDLANPLSAILAETQLLLMDPQILPAEAIRALKEIESLAIRMRSLLRST
ncbi:MAG: histidine kinase dimerization/phospho-acceptor domain-containing protein [Gemmatimonadales bacterium]